MLSQDDADLARRDRALPGLATVLDGDAMRAELAARDIVAPGDLVPAYVRYKPGTSCLVGYRSGSDRDGIRVHATAYADHQDDKSIKARLRASRAPKAELALQGGGYLYLERPRTAVSFFPVDVEIPVMARLEDPERSAALLARVFRDEPVAPRAEVERLAYKPGRRFVGRVCWPDGRSAVLRLYTSTARARALRIPSALHDGEVLRVARRVGGSKRHQAAAVEWISGKTLRDVLRSGGDFGDAPLEGVARAFAELHRTALVGESEIPIRGPYAGLVEVERELVRLVPELAESVSSLRDRIEVRLAALPLSNRLIHGDLYDKQVVVSREGVGLVDLDELGIGDPRQDLGLFLAHWERDRCLAGIETDDHGLSGELCDYYRCASEDRLHELPVFTAAALFRLAQQPFRTRSHDWRVKIGALLDRVRELLAS